MKFSVQTSLNWIQILGLMTALVISGCSQSASMTKQDPTSIQPKVHQSLGSEELLQLFKALAKGSVARRKNKSQNKTVQERTSAQVKFQAIQKGMFGSSRISKTK